MDMREDFKRFGRRSRLDIACDVLRVVSEGAERPTRIMYRANLTWPLTIAYLGVLLRNQMITTESLETRRVYKMTPKGASLLHMYTTLQVASSELDLDKIDLNEIRRTISARRVGVKKGASVDSLRTLLERSGYEIGGGTVRGRSGVEHTFDLITLGKEGKTGYVVKENVAVVDVIRAFVMQTDCDLKTCIVSDNRPEKEASSLAESYGLEITGSKELMRAKASGIS
jgi:predicted transcriptional regulator